MFPTKPASKDVSGPGKFGESLTTREDDMKTKTILATMILTLTSCGGGGSGDSGPSDSEACLSYCRYSCIKAANCLGAPVSEADVCTNSCYQAIEDGASGPDADQCSATGSYFTTLTCREFLPILGLGRATEAPPLDGESFAQMIAE